MGNIATYSIEKLCEDTRMHLREYRDAKERISGHAVKMLLHELLERIMERNENRIGVPNPLLYRLPADAAEAIAKIVLDNAGTIWPELKPTNNSITDSFTKLADVLNNASGTPGGLSASNPVPTDPGPAPGDKIGVP